MKHHEVRESLQSLRGASDTDLENRLNEAYREIFNLRMRHATRQLDNDRQLHDTRKAIARIKTVVRERALARELEAAGNGK